jgi:hypothetical protein
MPQELGAVQVGVIQAPQVVPLSVYPPQEGLLPPQEAEVAKLYVQERVGVCPQCAASQVKDQLPQVAEKVEQVPLTGLLGPPEHDPPEQASPTVHAFPSLQELPLLEQEEEVLQLPSLPQVSIWVPAQEPLPQETVLLCPGLAPPGQVVWVWQVHTSFGYEQSTGSKGLAAVVQE